MDVQLDLQQSSARRIGGEPHASHIGAAHTADLG